jgi:flavin reductase (DIM6/NTAB) family NADH-FMN oxidoreductase RutF
VCFDNDARTLPVVEAAGRFGINVLRSDQEALAWTFASKAPVPEKFDGIGYRLEDDIPILDGALAWLGCEVRELHPGGDHTIAIGAVTAMHHGDGEPLVWYRGGYHSLG